MTLRKFSLGAAVVLAMLGTGPVKAADLDPALEDPVQEIPSLPVSNVVFGSGWYVRGDFGGAQLSQANPFYRGNLTSAGDNSSAPGVTLKQGHEFGYIGDIGGGYAFTPYLRGDVTVDYHMPVHSTSYGAPFKCINGYGPVTSTTSVLEGVTTTTTSASPTYESCHGAYAANLQNYSALVNGYFDVGTWYGVTPYIGAGAGLAFGHYQTSSTYYQADGTSYDLTITNSANNASYHAYLDKNASHTYYNFAYALMAGFSFPIFAHTKVDIGYRFLDLGTVLNTNVRLQEVRAGLRYMIDN